MNRLPIIGENSSRGTEFKLNINMPPVDGYSLADVDFTAEVFTERGGRPQIVGKDEAIRVDDDNYIICIDSAAVGIGRYLLRLTVLIPDSHFKDGYRKEVRTRFTGVTIDAM